MKWTHLSKQQGQSKVKRLKLRLFNTRGCWSIGGCDSTVHRHLTTPRRHTALRQTHAITAPSNDPNLKSCPLSLHSGPGITLFQYKIKIFAGIKRHSIQTSTVNTKMVSLRPLLFWLRFAKICVCNRRWISGRRTNRMNVHDPSIHFCVSLLRFDHSTK